MSGNENPRWLPGSHIGFLILSKISLDMYLIMIQLHTKNHFNISNGSQDIERKWKSKMAAWRPYWISDWLQNRTLPVFISVHVHSKIHFHISNGSWVIERKGKSKMAAWQPYWISDRLQNRTWPLFYNDISTYQKSLQYLKRFSRYWVETKIQDTCLAAILHFRLAQNSNLTEVFL